MESRSSKKSTNRILAVEYVAYKDTIETRVREPGTSDVAVKQHSTTMPLSPSDRGRPARTTRQLILLHSTPLPTQRNRTRKTHLNIPQIPHLLRRLRLLLRPGRRRRLQLEPLLVRQVQETDEAEARADVVEFLWLVLGLQALDDAAELAALAEGGVFVVVDVL